MLLASSKIQKDKQVWQTVGLIQLPWGEIEHLNHSALQPTPIQVNDQVIRIFFGGRDTVGVSRVFFVDVEVDSPAEPVVVSPHAVLDVGEPGHFDDNGVVPTCVFKQEERYTLFYAGYQIPKRTKFLVFGGSAESLSLDGPFVRNRTTPLMDRRPGEELFRVPHTVMAVNAELLVWYGGGNAFVDFAGTQKPTYNIRHTLSKDGEFTNTGHVCLDPDPGESRLARPWVLKRASEYEMYFGAYTDAGSFRLGFAHSRNGIDWERDDNGVCFSGERASWEKDSRSYPAVVCLPEQDIMFFNGNDYGRNGIGVAVRRNDVGRRSQ